MAEAIYYSVVTDLLKKLGSAAVPGTGLAWGVSDELQNLSDAVSTIEAVLFDAEQRFATDYEVRDWLDKLKDAVYDAKDLLDEISGEVLWQKVMDQNAKKLMDQNKLKDAVYDAEDFLDDFTAKVSFSR